MSNRRRQNLLERRAKLDDLQGWLKEFQSESDRATAILGGAYIDAHLEELLKSFFVNDEEEVERLLSPDHPLGPFMVRARVAYCLGLITPNQFLDIETIGKIRNHFAHDMHGIDFDHPEIKDLCSKLIIPKLFGFNPDNTKTRSLYEHAVSRVCLWLRAYRRTTDREKRKLREEPKVVKCKPNE